MPLDPSLQRQVLQILDQVLSLDGAALRFDSGTPLLGALPEFDSLAVTSLLSALETQFGISFDDDMMSADTFATVGSLVDMVAEQLGAA